MAEGVVNAICVVTPTQGNNISGTITFTSNPDGVLVKGDIHGLTPGKHGFHIHECGDCSSADGSSAGGHFNPSNMPHGAPADMNRHEGDMGNIEADASGNAHIEYVDKMQTLNGPNSIIGRGVIVHKDADDLKSQPAGNAGPRLACGVIGIAK
jgi:Cu-Zn family superoxide dismutase